MFTNVAQQRNVSAQRRLASDLTEVETSIYIHGVAGISELKSIVFPSRLSLLHDFTDIPLEDILPSSCAEVSPQISFLHLFL